MKTTKDPHFGYLCVFNLDSSGTMRLFFENFLIVSKGPPFNFFDILEHNRCLKIPKGPPFQIFRHYETVQNCHFSSNIRFSQYISTNIFFNTIRNLNVIFGVKRYIRIFDAIFEVYSVSLGRRRRFENKCSHLSHPLYPNFRSVFPARKASFG